MTSGALSTAYTYSRLGNLTGVTQNGASGSVPRIRSFTYDYLSRLLCASNPENSSAPCPSVATNTYTSGTTGYVYDLNGNVTSKTDARGITVGYAYDGLNRLLAKTYPSGSTTPASCYQYDRTPTILLSNPIPNPVGHLTAEWTMVGACRSATDLPELPASVKTSKLFLNYDIMGRVIQEKQCATSGCATPFTFSYAYDLAGHTTLFDNGIGTLAWQPTYDTAGRLQTIGGAAPIWGTGPQYPSQVFDATPTTSDSHRGYGPAGITGWTMGTIPGGAPALTFIKDYDQRLRVQDESVTGHQ
ncbi:MAG: RHS repeat protein [Acidobacteriota bacterium]|nr:RHS repeat protein [Acidobacteriota bacterium]